MTAKAQPKIPSRLMERRQDNITLGDIFGKFNYKERSNQESKYRIPSHQRYPAWKKPAKQLLVDTVFRNYPMSGFVVSEHCEDRTIYYDFEDGQSRMSILQEYYQDGFAYEDENGQEVFFSELNSSIQRRFENYKIYIEVMSDFQDNSQFEVFERLQYGQPLTDKDLYWNRREYPYVDEALKLIQKEEWRKTYMNTTKGITDKNRNALPAVVTFIYAITQYHKLKQEEGSPSKRKSMWKSFRAQVEVLKQTISENDKNRMTNFLNYLNYIIDQVYSIYPTRSKEKVSNWNNFAKQTGIILHEWLENESQSQEIKKQNQQKWIEMMILERKSGNLMFKGNKTMWNGLSTSHSQNTDDASLAARLERVNNFYKNREQVASEHGIIYYIDGEDSNVESGDNEE